jgi:LmbE family N-acetylglucosaminyl deacetylase
VKIVKIVIFAPHPDDETFGAGGSIIKWLEEENDIHIIWLTDGRAGYRKPREEKSLDDCEETRISEEELANIRLEEAKTVAGFLGVKKKNRHFLKFYDQELKDNIEEAVEKIKQIVRNADIFVIPSNNNDHPDHQATYDIAIKIAEELDHNVLHFYVYNLHAPLRVQKENLIKIKVGNLRFKVYEALKLYKSQFYTKDMKWQAEVMKERRTEKFGLFNLRDRGKFYNF